jgi:hypothetical protein
MDFYDGIRAINFVRKSVRAPVGSRESSCTHS